MRLMTTRIAPLSLAAIFVAATAAAEPTVTPVTLKAPDGITLKGSYYSPGKPGPGLMLLHQCDSDRSAWASLAKAAAARGYHVMAFDYRGFGESEGARNLPPQEAGPIVAQQWPRDVDTAFDWLLKQPGVDKDRIGAAGASCGVNQALLLASRHPEVKTLVLLSGGVTAPAREYLRKAEWMPVLASGSDDDGGIVDTMRWILGWSKNPNNKFLHFKAAGHGTDMFRVEKTLEPALLEWFDANLRNAPAKPVTTASSPSAKPSPVEEFWTVLGQPGGAERARGLYDAAKSSGKAIVLFPEAELNARGYELLQDGLTKDAIIVFAMNVDAYPQSANVYDSLSDAYLADGNKVEALKYAEKTLQVLETDKRTPEQFKQAVRESAERKVKELKK